jgi:hypothetical protein
VPVQLDKETMAAMELMPHHTQVAAAEAPVMLAVADQAAEQVATAVLDWHLILAELLPGMQVEAVVVAQLAVFVQQALEQIHILEQPA